MSCLLYALARLEREVNIFVFTNRVLERCEYPLVQAAIACLVPYKCPPWKLLHEPCQAAVQVPFKL